MQDKSVFFTQKHVVYLTAAFCCLLWGSAYPAIKMGYALLNITADDIPSQILFAGYRFTLAGLVLLALAAMTGKPLARMNRTQFGQLTLLGLTQTTIQYIFFYVGLSAVSGANGSIINATGTFFSVIMAHFIYKNDRISMNKLLGCLFGFAGVLIVNFNGSLMDFHFTLRGEGLVMLAAFVLSATSIYGKRISQTMEPGVMTGYQLTIGGVVLTAVGFLCGGSLTGFDLTSVLLLAYMVLLSSMAFSLWSILLKYNRVGMVVPFNFLIPVSGTALSALLLKENIFQWKYAVALVLVCTGIYLVNRVKKIT
ncbi:DMT family transporter [Budviciaceae bacterium CWB-B4]|uniref:Threonine/homoserine exporter RhtA n=1 Tax=Limnobaculum xujianqingii TaxID=2738837 RepID=A0A9D7AL68_9GAMM|nr:DMT family transporter [Limnobaculum xujianqingii]MBK5074699.1 DMT family transporter [Limnobaculum xujianqingii]MBK5177969.1 DMT family transporter [Limnobaculum xujianqingii]